MLIPFIFLFGLYVQFHGDYGPGGGFQAGAILASAVILYALLEGEAQALRALPMSVLKGLLPEARSCTAPLVLPNAFGRQLPRLFRARIRPDTGQHIGIILIELGVGITVTGVLLCVFHAFAARGKV